MLWSQHPLRWLETVLLQVTLGALPLQSAEVSGGSGSGLTHKPGYRRTASL